MWPHWTALTANPGRRQLSYVLEPVVQLCPNSYQRHVSTFLRGGQGILRANHCLLPKCQRPNPSSVTSLVAHPRIPIALYMSTANPTQSSVELHKQTVEEVSRSVRRYYEKGEKFRIYHGSTNSTRQSDTKRNLVDTSALSKVLKVDVKSKTCLVEPNVPMDRLVEATLQHGLVPPVVMEFPGITVGGGYSGTSGESSSFKHGFFDRTINSVEMVMADGSVTTLSPTEKPDLFRGAAGAVGTFGVTTLIELQLYKAKKYVETTYHPVSSMAEAIQKLKEVATDPNLDYVDGIMFSLTKGAIITGRLTDDRGDGLSVQKFSGARDPWFYMHVEKQISKRTEPTTEAIPLAEYLFRYDRGGFWVGESAFKYFKVPFTRFTRWLLDDFLHTRMMYTALDASGQSNRYVVQDLALPYATAERFVQYADKTFGIYPLWLCPLKQSPLPTMHPHYNETQSGSEDLEPMLNIGLWGFGPSNYDEFVRKNRDLERKLRELGGMKWLYAHTYYTEDEFWGQFDRNWYDQLREKYNATSLPSVYEKVKVDIEAKKQAQKKIPFFRTTWPFSGFYGIKKAIESRSYVAARKSLWKSIGK